MALLHSSTSSLLFPPACRARGAVPAVLTAVLIATAGLVGMAPTPAAAKPTCVWSKGTDSKAMGRYLKGWARRHGLGAIRKWGVSLKPRQARITLSTERVEGVVVLRLGSDCRRRPRVTTVAAQRGGRLPLAALEDLARTFPAPRKKVLDVGPEDPWERGPSSWAFALVALGLVLLAWGAQRLRLTWRRVAFGLIAAGVSGLCAVAVAPLFSAPFSGDAEILRTAYAAENIFGDWNHPFGQYALNHIPTRLSLEPWALRIVPFGYVIGQAILLMVVARRHGGLAAAALAGTWLACEVRRRQSINVLADWDLAGIFLLGLVLWAHTGATPPGEDRPDRRWLWLSLLLLGSFFASYMMFVPITVIVALVWLDPQTRGRTALVSTGVWLVCAIKALGVFRQGSELTAIVTRFDELTRQMYLELPISRSAWMGIPLTAGLVWLIWGWRRLDHRLVLGTTVAIPAATVVAWRWSHVNHGYYVCLLTPLLLLAGGVAVSRGGSQMRQWLADRTHPAVGWTAVAAGLALLTLATVNLPEYPRDDRYRPTGLANLARFEKRVSGDDLLILTNAEHLTLYWSYDRARRRAPRPGRMLSGKGPPDLSHRFRRVRPSDRLERGWKAAEPRFYYVTETGDRDKPQPMPPSRYQCERLYRRTTWLNFYRCTLRAR